MSKHNKKKLEQEDSIIQSDKKAQILPINIEDEMKASYIDYAMSVLVGRAIPDVRDGLKPVHRRILYSMDKLGLQPGKPYKKSARVVGDCLGQYHPHGDLAVYDALVRMAQDFSLRYTLADGQGNFGSVDGDSAAAMRYCVSGDTRIVTEKGLPQIEHIPHHSEVSLKILSADEKINHASKWFDSGEHPTKIIETHRGFSLCGSFNHPILTWQKKNGDQPGFRWKLLKDLKTGDYAVISRSNLLFPEKEPSLTPYHSSPKNRSKPHWLPCFMSEDLAFILGAIVAEGNINQEQIGFCNNDKEFIRKFKASFKKAFPSCRLHEFVRQPVGFTKKPYTSLEIHSKLVIEFLKNLGLLPGRAKGRVVPEIIFSSSKKSIAAFLRGFAEGDGSVYISSSLNNLEICFISVSQKLMQDLQILLLRFGIDSSYRFQRTRNTYKLFIRNHENLNLFKQQINFVTKRKRTKLAEISKRNRSGWVMSKMDFIPYLAGYLRQVSKYNGYRDWMGKHNLDRYPKIEKHWKHLRRILDKEDLSLYEGLRKNRYIFDEVVSVKPGGVKKVYSIKVDGPCHSFVSNGFISHNTEARLSPIAAIMLEDLEKETVTFSPNFDESLKEPTVLPAKLPNLLVNGTSGIAVGMATNMAPHNLSESVDAVNYVIDNPEAGIKDIMKFIPGPDFPTGALICGRQGIKDAYETGRGIITLRAKLHQEDVRGGKVAIIVTEMPYQVNKAETIKHIAELVKDKKISGVSDLRDESDREGMRVYIELKRDTNIDLVLNQLFKHTDLQTSFGINSIALVDGVPKLLNLKELIDCFIKHREEVVTRRTKFDLAKAEHQAHILEGLRIAVSNIDAIIKLIKGSKNPDEARVGLMKKFKLSEIQAQAILDLRLQRLTQLERHKIEEDYKAIKELIKELKELLASRKKMLGVIKKELTEIKEKHGDKRKTEITGAAEQFEYEELIAEEDVAVVITRDGFVKRMPVTTFRAQLRGGRGVTGMATREEDEIREVFVASTHSHVLFFTNFGKVYQVKTYELPEAGRTGKGQSIANFLNFAEKEFITATLSVTDFAPARPAGGPDKYLMMSTRKGMIKKTDLSKFANIRKTGIIAMKLDTEDELGWVAQTGGKDEVIIGTQTGIMIRFPEKGVRDMGRGAGGVRGIKLDKKDKVVCMDVVEKGADLMAITEAGFGKRMEIGEFGSQNRGGRGHIAMKLRDKDKVARMMLIHEDDEILFVSAQGTIMRQRAKGISRQGRYAKGVRIQRVAEGDYIVDMARVVVRAEEESIEKAAKEAEKKAQEAQDEPLESKFNLEKIKQPRRRRSK